jgi:hypothetical protein
LTMKLASRETSPEKLCRREVECWLFNHNVNNAAGCPPARHLNTRKTIMNRGNFC